MHFIHASASIRQEATHCIVKRSAKPVAVSHSLLQPSCQLHYSRLLRPELLFFLQGTAAPGGGPTQEPLMWLALLRCCERVVRTGTGVELTAAGLNLLPPAHRDSCGSTVHWASLTGQGWLAGSSVAVCAKCVEASLEHASHTSSM